jgi:hypothetical protein
MTPTTSGRMQRRTGLIPRAFPLQQARVKFAARPAFRGPTGPSGRANHAGASH